MDGVTAALAEKEKPGIRERHPVMTPTPPAPRPGLRLRPRRLAGSLAGIAGLLVLAGLASEFVDHRLGYDEAYGLVPRFGLDVETSVQTFFSTALLLIVSALMLAAGRVDRARGEGGPVRWYALSLLTFVMAADEAAGIHELLIRPVREIVDATGFVYFAWVIPGALLVVLIVVLNWGFVSGLPRRTRRGLVAASALYFGGALGVEAVGGAYAEVNGQDTLAYGLIVAVEEGLEMAGLVLAIYAMATHVAVALGAAAFRVSVDPASAGRRMEPIGESTAASGGGAPSVLRSRYRAASTHGRADPARPGRRRR